MATVVTNAGKAIITAALNALGAGSKPEWVAWGTGAGTAAITDTTLFTESTEETRVQGTTSQQTTTTTNDTYRVVATLTVATSNKTITNAGVFTASTVGTLFQKGDFTGIALNIGDSIQLTFNTQLS
jgi:hypothetical protein